jgi:hypothetical protein
VNTRVSKPPRPRTRLAAEKAARPPRDGHRQSLAVIERILLPFELKLAAAPGPSPSRTLAQLAEIGRSRWPDASEAIGHSGSSLAHTWNARCRFEYRHAAAITPTPMISTYRSCEVVALTKEQVRDKYSDDKPNCGLDEFTLTLRLPRPALPMHQAPTAQRYRLGAAFSLVAYRLQW